MTQARAILDHAISEREFQQQIADLARLYGWKVHSVWDSRHSPAGWPDLFMIRNGEVLAWEVKREDGRAKATEAQREWLYELRRMPGMRWYSAMVVRPSSWDFIVSILSGTEQGGRNQ